MEEMQYLDNMEKKPSVEWTDKPPIVTVTQPIQMTERSAHGTRTRYFIIGIPLALLSVTASMTVLTYAHVKYEGIYGGEEQSGRRITKRQSSNPCVSDCTNVTDGDYQSCNGCNVYVTCSSGSTIDDRPCPSGLEWDDSLKRCEFTSTTCFPDEFDLNETCLQTNACMHPNVECGLISCVCPENYFENNGTCEQLKYAGENCTSDIECKGDNIECSGSPQTCRCPSDRYLDFTTGNCEQKKLLEESCEPGQCGTTNSVCVPIFNTCGCQEGYFDDNGEVTGGNCSEKLGLNEECLQTDACSDPNAECLSLVCSCKVDFFDNGGFCEPLKYIGENCTETAECRGDNTECSGSPSTCRCPSDRYLDFSTGNCMAELVLGDSCEVGQCGTTNSVCNPISNTCTCADGYYDNGATSGGSCTEKLGLDIACPQTDACSDVNAVCSTTCTCGTEYYNNDGTCEPLLYIGETCSATSDCRGSNVECSGSPATCRCPPDRYLEVTSGDCLTKLVLGDSCEAGQCGTTNSVCDPISNTCACTTGYYDDNGTASGGSCSAKLVLDAGCSQTDACADVNSVCSTTCTCITDYYNNGGACEPLLYIGGSCSAAADCKGSNVECSGSPATCRCPPNRFLDETSGDCLLRSAAIGEACVAGQCTANNAVCDSDTSTCQCPDGYQYDGANCLLCPSLDWEVFNGSCYFFSTEELRYNPARTLCDRFDTSTENSNLVQVDTSAELTFLKNFMTNRAFQPTYGYWNDLYEVTTNGNEVWRTSGDPLTVSDWNPGQPREDNNTVQKCTIFYGPFLYRQMDTTCDGRLAAPLCEITPA